MGLAFVSLVLDDLVDGHVEVVLAALVLQGWLWQVVDWVCRVDSSGAFIAWVEVALPRVGDDVLDLLVQFFLLISCYFLRKLRRIRAGSRYPIPPDRALRLSSGRLQHSLCSPGRSGGCPGRRPCPRACPCRR